jgi:hypothetical protein
MFSAKAARFWTVTSAAEEPLPAFAVPSRRAGTHPRSRVLVNSSSTRSHDAGSCTIILPVKRALAVGATVSMWMKRRTPPTADSSAEAGASRRVVAVRCSTVSIVDVCGGMMSSLSWPSIPLCLRSA